MIPVPIRRATALLVSRPPDQRWCFHWHEIVPLGDPGSRGGEAYLPALEAGKERRAVCERLRTALRDSPPEHRFTVQEGYLIEVVRDAIGLLPANAEDAIRFVLEGKPLSETG